MQRRHNFQTISWFYDLYTRNLLNLNPPYQRRSVWNQAYKDYFIDTILLNYPAPAIFVYEDIDRTGIPKYSIVDGKQRLMTIFEFIKGSYPVYDKAIKSELRGRYFDDLSSDVVNNIWTYTFTVEYVPTDDESIINNIFDRINRNVVQLTYQELRHAKFSGIFITMAEELTEWLFETLGQNFPRITGKSRRQMKDVELIAQLLLMIEEKGAKGYSSDELDEAFSNRDTEWEKKNAITQTFKNTVEIIRDILEQDRDNILIRSRFQNQADFYSFFGVIFELVDCGNLPDTSIILEKLKVFLSLLLDETQREQQKEIAQYYEYARSASNRTTARKERTRILKEFLIR